MFALHTKEGNEQGNFTRNVAEKKSTPGSDSEKNATVWSRMSISREIISLLVVLWTGRTKWDDHRQGRHFKWTLGDKAIGITLYQKVGVPSHPYFSLSLPFPIPSFFIFTALHVMQTRYCEEISVRPSVRLSVRLSVRHTRDPWQNGRKICPDYIPYERTFILVSEKIEWLVGGDPFYLKFWVNRPPLERNRRFSTNNRS